MLRKLHVTVDSEVAEIVLGCKSEVGPMGPTRRQEPGDGWTTVSTITSSVPRYGLNVTLNHLPVCCEEQNIGCAAASTCYSTRGCCSATQKCCGNGDGVRRKGQLVLRP